MKTRMYLLILLGLFLAGWNAPAQILDVRRAVKNKLTERVNNQIDQAIDRQLNKVETAVTDSIKKKNQAEAGDKAAAGESGGEAGSAAQADAAGSAGNAAAAGKPAQQELKVYSKYDFIPGEKVIFFDDFAQDNIGDFPALWNTNASGEVVTATIKEGHWLRMTGAGFSIPDMKAEFPDNFTVEFDWINVISDEFTEAEIGFSILSADPKDPQAGGATPGDGGIRVFIHYSEARYDCYTQDGYYLSGQRELSMAPNTLNRISISVQKQRFRLYLNEVKLFDLPRAMPEGMRMNTVRFDSNGYNSPLISNLRVAAGQPDMRSKLITEGRLVTYGIYFDVNSDKVKPESYGTLKGIAAVLTENPGVKVRIIGHTDADGNDAANLDLSKRRAASVRSELSKTFGIDASRMETDGKGEGAPVAPNDTPTNKALNRRVEFVKL